MNTAERADAIASAWAGLEEFGAPSATDLTECVRHELGHAEILDGFRDFGGGVAMALPLGPILHVVSGNTPHAALQTLTRGLLVGAVNFCKLPAVGLPQVSQFLGALPGRLADRVQVASEIFPDWRKAAAVQIVFGSDETVRQLRNECPGGTVFVAHAHKWSMGVVNRDPDFASCAAAARDVSRFDQMGCLSPHVFFVAGDPEAYASKLAGCLAALPSVPREAMLEDLAGVATVRADWEFRASVEPGIRIWKSDGLPGWTVVSDPRDDIPVSPGHRFVFVKPLTDDLPQRLAPHSHHLGALGLWPCCEEDATPYRVLGFSRICPIGRMQAPPFSWHAGGAKNLAQLVRWVDFEH